MAKTIAEIRDGIIDKVIAVEGGYVDDPTDSGGETNHGITKAVAEACGYKGNMKDMPIEFARSVYDSRYWTPLKCDEICSLSESIAGKFFDIGVNLGVSRAAEFLQRSLNVFNRSESIYGDIEVDKIIGPKTILALCTYLELRDEEVLFKALNSLQCNFYIELAERREKDEKFVYGWIKQRID